MKEKLFNDITTLSLQLYAHFFSSIYIKNIKYKKVKFNKKYFSKKIVKHMHIYIDK